jgi:ssDNA-binding Zn-finger/Zn-ribbon topoisomerase 1
LVTLSDFTEAAIEEAKRLRVQLVDGRSLLERIERVRQSEACPLCGTPMVLDRSSRGWWLRCPRFSGCGGKRDLAQPPGAAVDLLLRPELRPRRLRR